MTLTAEQREVLALSATGRGTAEVAAALNLPVETVRTYLRAAIVQLEARSKLEAVVMAVRSGLVELPTP